MAAPGPVRSKKKFIVQYNLYVMKKANKDSIEKKRLQIEEEYKISKSTALNQIKAIAKKSAAITTAQIPEKKFDKLYKLLYDPNLLYQAMEKISKSEGALTIGPPLDKTTADNSSSKLIENISNELKSETFRFKPIRRIYIDKTGKNRNINDQIKDLKDKSPEAIKLLKARPLGIPAFKDKIVQEAIRIILNAIYEPEFAKANYNFGFRSGLGCHDAIYNIQRYSKAMKYAIEGDIKGAFDNVKFSKLEQLEYYMKV
jgi:retron-type reverse transcriptase